MATLLDTELRGDCLTYALGLSPQGGDGYDIRTLFPWQTHFEVVSPEDAEIVLFGQATHFAVVERASAGIEDLVLRSKCGLFGLYQHTTKEAMEGFSADPADRALLGGKAEVIRYQDATPVRLRAESPFRAPFEAAHGDIRRKGSLRR